MNATEPKFPSTTSENNPSILIADDDLTTRSILTGIIKKWGYEPLVVKTGREAWEILQQPDSPLLVILDWMMPEMDGPEVIRQVRARGGDRPPYIILLTSRDEKSDIFSGLESGANDYIKKPFEPEELYARIRVGQRTIDLQTSLYEAKLTLEHLATHDPLTGTLNRRAIFEQFSRELYRARRGGYDHIGKKLCVGYFDIDHFKTVNDTHGHQAGDDILCGIADLLNKQLRAYDLFSRLGGDEFLLIAPEISEQNYKLLFDRLINTVASTPFKTVSGDISVTISLGVVGADLDCTEDHILSIADEAMYRSKHAGGNCVTFA